MLRLGIVGLPNVGKSTLFNALTRNDVLAANYPFATIEPNVGVVGVPDPRLHKLAEIFGSAKILPATVDFVDAMLVVVEPTRRSLGTAAQIKKLANDLKLNRLYLVGNKVRNDDEAKFLETETPGLPVLGFLPADLKVQEADRLGIPVYDHVPSLKESAAKMVQKGAGELLVTSMDRDGTKAGYDVDKDLKPIFAGGHDASVLAVAGIARPERFFEAVASAGWRVVGTMPFRDHHIFTPRDVQRIAGAGDSRQHGPGVRLVAKIALRERRQGRSKVLGVRSTARDSVALHHSAIGHVSGFDARVEVGARDGQIWRHRQQARHHETPLALVAERSARHHLHLLDLPVDTTK